MSPSKTSPKRSFVADSLATGMLVMLLMTVVQRGVGFLRGIWFCRLLDDSLLGQWSMAYDFVILITPVMLLGIPGSMPRYVEHFRARGQLPALIRRLLIVTALLGALFFTLLNAIPQWFGWLVFSDRASTSLVHSVGVCVVSFVVFSFVYQLVSSLRQVRVVSLMQFLQSVVFTFLGVAWLSYGGALAGLIYAFAVATLIAMIPGLITLRSGWQGLPPAEDSFDAPSMWRRLLPYAAALWIMNLLTNVFFLSDRYMILHLLPGGEIDGTAAVGQYHSGRIIPGLLMSVATMISGVLMPYLTADWEAGHQQRVRERLHQILFGVAALFTAGAAVSLWIAPWLFSEFLEGRYSAGLDLMPMAFVIAIWFALAMIAQNYLWVAERGKLVATAMGVGLLVNIVLNYLLLPVWGLHGAVVATMLANGVMLVGVWVAMSRLGFAIDMSILFLTFLPATLLAGPSFAILFVVLTLFSSTAARQSFGELRQAIDRRRAARLAS